MAEHEPIDKTPELPLPHPGDLRARHMGPEQGEENSGASGKIARVVAAGAIAVSAGAAVENASASPQVTPPKYTQAYNVPSQKLPDSLSRISLQKMNEDAAAAKRVLEGRDSSNEASKKIDPAEFTSNFLKGMYDGKIKFGYFNGLVIIDNQAEIYGSIDPNFTPYGKKGSQIFAYPKISSKNPPAADMLSTMNSFGPGSRPVTVNIDGTLWLMFSIASVNYEPVGSTGPGYNLVDQANPENLFYIPLNKRNAGHVSFYKYGKGPTFLSGAISHIADASIPGAKDLMVTTQGYGMPPSDLAAWMGWRVDKATHSYNDGVREDPYFMPNSKLNTFIKPFGKPLKKYKMPSPKKVMQMIASEAP